MKKNRIVKMLSLCLTVLLLLSLCSCLALGNRFIETDDVTYTFEEKNGILTISGNGSMDNYTNPNYVPWYDKRDKIIRVVIENGVNSIGECAFYDCDSLTSIEIPYSVTSIGGSAFCGCDNLTSISIPGNVTIIGFDAFSGCSSLTSISIPDSVTSIGSQAFKGCRSLTSISITDSVTRIGSNAFLDCTRLTNIYYSGTKAHWNKIAKVRGDKNKTVQEILAFDTGTIHCVDIDIVVE